MQFQTVTARHRSGIAAFLLLAVFLAFGAGCASTQSGGDDAESLYQEADTAFKDERFLIAIEKYREVKNRFPYSARAADAELRIADAYFAQEMYLEAEAAYEIFKELHPTNAKVDYVQYQIAMSFYNQIPANTARDLSAAYRAIDSFQTLIDKYPSSQYAAKGKEAIIDARRKLAEHENYVADFYFRRRHFLSSSYRYSALLQDYPNLGYDEEGLFRLGLSYYNVRMYTNARDTLARFVKQYPESAYKSEAQTILDEIASGKKQP